MIITKTIKYEGTFVIEDTTGEVVAVVPDTRQKKKVSDFDKAIGVDTKYPKDCVTKDSLLDALSVMDAYLDTTPKVNMGALVKSVTSKYLTVQQLALIDYLTHNVVAWNFYMGSIKDICNACGVPSASFSRVISDLTPNTLRVLHRDRPLRGDIVIQISPFLVWKGDTQYRESKMGDWYVEYGKTKKIDILG